MNKPASLFKSTSTEAELEIRRMCDNSPLLIWVTNSTGADLYFNKAWRDFTGLDNSNTPSQWYELIHPDDVHGFQERTQRHFAAHSAYRAEYRLRRRDGVYRWIISHAAPNYGPQGEFLGFVGSAFDFNDQHEFETTLATRALKQSALATFGRFALEQHSFSALIREAVKVILETLHVDCAYLASVNPETRALSLEANACRLNKTPPRDLGAATLASLGFTRAVQMADDPENFPLAPLITANGIQSSIVCPVGTGKQLYGFIFANSRNTRTFSSEAVDFIQGLAITLNTVCQRERAEKALAASEQKLLQSQKVEAIGLLAGGIAHDFNNLLTVIRGYTELLQKDIGPLAADSTTHLIRNHAAGIVTAADRASKLVRQLLAFSRSQATQVERIDLNMLVLELQDLITAFLRSGVRLELQLPPAPVFAYVDRTQIEQVILNLAINARDAMPQGGCLTISVASEQIGGSGRASLSKGLYARISVSDTGTGISPEAQAKIFTPFFSTKPKNRGSGLGLATCANIIKNARGEISFDTQLGQGTTFRVLLPDFTAAGAIEPEPSVMKNFFGETETPAEDPRIAEPALDADLPAGTETLLLVEDDPAIRDVTQAILESLGYTVHAFSAGEALITSAADPATRANLMAAQLLITDINMPGMGGRQLADRVRAMRPGIRVLFISGFINDALQQSGAMFLEKPFTREVLAKKIRQILQH